MNGADQGASASKAPIITTTTATASSRTSSKLSCPSVFYMFMFRSKRNGLLKRLWRAAGRAECDDLLLDTPDSNLEEQAPPHQQQVGWIKSAARALFKRMTDDQLACLLDIVEGTASTCLLLDSDLGTTTPPPESAVTMSWLQCFCFVCRLELSGGQSPAAVPHLSMAGHARRRPIEADVPPAGSAFRLLQSLSLLSPLRYRIEL